MLAANRLYSYGSEGSLLISEIKEKGDSYVGRIVVQILEVNSEFQNETACETKHYVSWYLSYDVTLQTANGIAYSLSDRLLSSFASKE